MTTELSVYDMETGEYLGVINEETPYDEEGFDEENYIDSGAVAPTQGNSRKEEMLMELWEAREQGVCYVWYGHVEQAEWVDIDDAIRDIEQMDPDVIGEGTWGF